MDKLLQLRYEFKGYLPDAIISRNKCFIMVLNILRVLQIESDLVLNYNKM
jgi:hypothetical protein